MTGTEESDMTTVNRAPAQRDGTAARTARRLGNLEIEILQAGLDASLGGRARFHGFQISKTIAGGKRRAGLLGHGTLYKALARLESAGYVTSEWEDPSDAAAERRPRRRLYRVTDRGAAALRTVTTPKGAVAQGEPA